MEAQTASSLRSARDWLHADRNAIERRVVDGLSIDCTSASNTFVTACSAITQSGAPEEMTEPIHRTLYYAVVQCLLRKNVETEDVRFFSAAQKVSGALSVLTLPALSHQLHGDPEYILLGINRRLHALNIWIVNALLFDIGFPFKVPASIGASSLDPHGQAPISAFQFDLNMVELEQSEVSRFLSENPSNLGGNTIAVLERNMNATEIIPGVKPNFYLASELLTAVQWAKSVLQQSTLKFTDYKHRRAIGWAVVHVLHNRDKNAFATFIGANQ